MGCQCLFYLIRHGEHDWLQRGIAGRIKGVLLNAEGRDQARELAGRLASVKFDAIYSSPMERAVETARPLASAQGKEVLISPDITELDFGEWNGKTTEELNADVRWAQWNRDRTTLRMPSGELMSEVQNRMVRFLTALHANNENGTFAVFSHGDSIRAAVCYWLGVPMDLLPRLQVDTGSVSVLGLDHRGPQIIGVNDCGAVGSRP